MDKLTFKGAGGTVQGTARAIVRETTVIGVEFKMFWDAETVPLLVPMTISTADGQIVVKEETSVDAPRGFIEPSYWQRLVRYLIPGYARPAIALVGPAGNGKTTAAENVLQALGYTYLVVDATEYLEPADLVGSMTYDPQVGEVWRDGVVTAAFRRGAAIIINEADSLNPRAALCLQSVFQDAGPKKLGRYVTTTGNPDEDRVFPQGDCPVILTMNTWGDGPNRQYVGRNSLDAATKDRLTIITTGYENEDIILLSRGYDAATVTEVMDWAQKVRKVIAKEELRVMLSLRTLLRICQAVEDYELEFDDATTEEFYERFDPETMALLKV
jgi:MoxR-like ATPase